MIRRIGFWPLLGVVAILSLALRLVGLDWDQGLYLHPDERFVVWVTSDLRWPESIGQYFNAATSPLNPYNTQHDSFVYGTFPSFLVKAIAGVFGMDHYGELQLVGRAVNAVCDMGTVILTAMLARRFFSEFAGIIAGLLLAFTPLFIQSAHFFTVDTISVFFAIAAFACVVRSWDRHSIGWMGLAGVMVGLAGASKPNYLIALGFLALPVLELIRIRGWKALVPRLQDRVYPALPAALMGGLIAFWTFRFAQPYAFAGPNFWNISLNQEWLDDISFWRAVQTGLVDMKPSIQWIERTPIVYIMENMVFWGMGFVLGIFAIAVLLLAIWRLIRSKHWPSWWWLGIVGWCLFTILMYGTGIAQNQRYLMHIYPMLILLVAGLLDEARRRLDRKWIAHAVTIVVVGYTVVFGIAYATLYVRPITRIEASEWIYDNVQPGSVLSNEYWDDALPMPLPGEERSGYVGMTLDLYADEAGGSEKVTTLVGQLSQVDYVVLSSNRVIDSVVRQPERYPVANRFYEMLLSGELGFKPVAHFHQGPEILGIEWDDRSAEESLTVYEHPEVRIFVKTDAFDAQFIHDELLAAWGYGGLHYIPGDPLPSQMLQSADAVAAQNEQGSWGDQVGDGWLQAHPLISWWLAMQVVGLAAWGLVWRGFRKLPDLGWMLAKVVGLLAVAVITLGLVSWLGFAFNRTTVGVAILLLLTASIASIGNRWNEFTNAVRQRWPNIVAGELLFLGVFLGSALIRSWQAIVPDHNLAMLTGVMRSVSLPPMDSWLSGGLLHTYWAGLLPWAALGRLLSLEPAVVMHVGAIGAVAMIAGMVWSLVRAFGRSWLGVLAAVVVAFGSSFSFDAGILPHLGSGSTVLGLFTALLSVLLLVHALQHLESIRWSPLGLIALSTGAVMVTSSWGTMVAIILLAIGLGINAFSTHTETDPWWPTARRFVLELIGVLAVGVAIWYPALTAHTSTVRNLMTGNLLSLSTMQDQFGLVLIIALVITMAIGGVSVVSTLVTDEGNPGIIVAGIAIGAMLSLLVASWLLNSALILLLLISLLAITAAWHWLDDASMLWSAALVLVACFVSAVAQTRGFRPGPNGTSIDSELHLLAWLLMIVAVAIGFSRAISHLRLRQSGPAILAAAIVAIAMLMPTFSQQHSTAEERVSLANPSIQAQESELQAANWFTENTSGSPVILSLEGTISAISGYPTVLGDQSFEINTRPGWDRMVDGRTQDVATIYNSLSDWDLAQPLLQKYDVRFIVVGNEERARFGGVDRGVSAAVANGNLQLVFEYEDVAIYRVLQVGPED